MLLLILLTCTGATLLALTKLLLVPSDLAHLPRVPLLPLLLSYLSLEPEDARIRRLVLPFANDRHEPVVLVWAFGMWVVHIIDYEVGQAAMKDKTWARELPPQDLLFWKFVGHQNLVFTAGSEWKKHTRVVTAVFQRPAPVAAFDAVARRLVGVIQREIDAGAGEEGKGKGRGTGGGKGTAATVQWDALARRVTIDILGTTILGTDLRALEHPDGPITSTYNRCMAGLTAPPYIFLPFLDKYFPRRGLVRDVAFLRGHFGDLIREKRERPGDDLISLMLAEPTFGERDVLDNVSLFFVAGHETTAGALSSIIYYLATHPEHQATARAEITHVLSPSPTTPLSPTLLTQMPFTHACILESLRMNSPSNFTLPRRSAAPTTLGPYPIPRGALMCFSMAAVHHAARAWPDTARFAPGRFLDPPRDGAARAVNAETAARTAPFGAGLRQCPARHFAMWELRALVARLLVEFRWALPRGSTHEAGVRNAFSFSTNLNLPWGLGVCVERVGRG